MSSSALCAIAHWGGRSSIPEAAVFKPEVSGVLDAPPTRGLTVGNVIHIPATEIRPSLASALYPRNQEGAGNAGCWPHPRALRAKGSALLRTQAATGQPGQPAFPARWFTAYTWSPRCPALLSHRHPAKRPQNLIPASGDRYNTISLV